MATPSTNLIWQSNSLSTVLGRFQGVCMRWRHRGHPGMCNSNSNSVLPGIRTNLASFNLHVPLRRYHPSLSVHPLSCHNIRNQVDSSLYMDRHQLISTRSHLLPVNIHHSLTWGTYQLSTNWYSSQELTHRQSDLMEVHWAADTNHKLSVVSTLEI